MVCPAITRWPPVTSTSSTLASNSATTTSVRAEVITPSSTSGGGAGGGLTAPWAANGSAPTGSEASAARHAASAATINSSARQIVRMGGLLAGLLGGLDQRGVEAARGEQLAVGAVLDD